MSIFSVVDAASPLGILETMFTAVREKINALFYCLILQGASWHSYDIFARVY